jgi:HEPN domain-containing protein
LDFKRGLYKRRNIRVMTNLDLALSYITKAKKRLKILDVLMQEEAYSDVIREAQEIVELATKAMLRKAGIDPPKWHDVSGLLLEYKGRFPKQVQKELAKVAKISKQLRKERELSFYGDIDFIPTEEYTRKDGGYFLKGATFVVEIALKLF